MINDLVAERRKKLNNFIQAGIEPYPERARRTHKISEAIDNFSSLSKGRRKIFLCGRILGSRVMGNIVFYDLADESGRIQAVLKNPGSRASSLRGPDNFKLFRDNLDIGDFVEAAGILFQTKSGEKSLEIKNLRLLAKSLRPLPSQWYGLENIETRLRQRYLDILMNVGEREMFVKKNIFWAAIRDLLREEGFLEIETPVFELTPGGAEAEPFLTHHNALNQDFYLRISLEIALKKLLVAGYEKIFEIGRVFRNEGIDAEHLQDYTQMEFYWAYADHEALMKFVEKMYKAVIKRACGGLITEWRGYKVNWGKKWPKIDYQKVFQEKTGIDLMKVSREDLFKKAVAAGLEPEKKLSKGRIIDLLFKKIIRPHLIQPCFLIGHPKLMSPLAKSKKESPDITTRVQVLACGTEVGNGWSELNDPIDQRKRFEEQMKLRAEGDKEAMRLDEDFLEAIEYGMPPAAGFGLSERLFAVLMNRPIRETTIFPLMRREK